MQYDLEAIENTVSRYVEAGTHKNLIARIGLEEFRNHVSCVFSTPMKTLVLSPWFHKPITPLPRKRILVGFTAAYPVSNPNANQEQNKEYQNTCRSQLEQRHIPYIDAYGEALDFERSQGCFIVSVRSLSDLGFVLNDQLSCLVVDSMGFTQLHSLLN